MLAALYAGRGLFIGVKNFFALPPMKLETCFSLAHLFREVNLCTGSTRWRGGTTH
jgi:hypothetical protein